MKVSVRTMWERVFAMGKGNGSLEMRVTAV